ncbi:hypothetical protein GCM10023169_13290 [Georgenia halophila]|uniref:HTH araC/xylS-type domain-containing protein n=1 Tax=Georgenia halophila TaxID=620889 RepID=A0ABP8KX38_9MICO
MTGRSSGGTSAGPVGRLRTVRSDGTPVFRYDARPGVAPVSVVHVDHDTSDLPSDHRHAHDFLVLVYVEEGSGTVSIGGEEWELRDGTVIAVPPGQVMGVSAISRITHSHGWSVFFTPDAVPSLASVSPLAWSLHPLLSIFVADGGRALVPEADRQRWSSWFAELAEEVSDPSRLGARDAVAALLTRILVAASRLAPPAGSVPDQLVTRVFDEIEAVFTEPVSAGDVAASLGYTTGHLTTVVRERTGRTLLDWITERRMVEARRLLAETDLTLAAIASRTGLRDAAYLGRRFREWHGVTPERWRRSTRSGQVVPRSGG